ncbi:hypothetical protein ACI6Q2_06200 [Chitinophagaceae bacterium LWZ2-11]
MSGAALGSCLESTIRDAQDFIWLISPKIKLHERIKMELRQKKDPNLQIVIVFGEDSTIKRKCLSLDDFDFLKQFPNISIICEKNLCANMYANEAGCLITSMDLQESTSSTHIDAGIYTKAKGSINKLASDLAKNVVDNKDPYQDAFQYFSNIIEHTEPLFKKTPQFQSALLGLSKKYTGSIIEFDTPSTFFIHSVNYANTEIDTERKIIVPKVEEKIQNTQESPTQGKQPEGLAIPDNKVEETVAEQNPSTGYCIQTGRMMAFNPDKPMSYEAYIDWLKEADWDEPCNYCHKTGKLSFGKTSMRNPILL